MGLVLVVITVEMTFDEGMNLEDQKNPNNCILQGVHHDSLAEVTF
jgi:hypothetical protein